MAEKNLVLDVGDKPEKVSQWFLFAIQHILAMLVACITVPIITGLPIGPTIVAAGIGTLIYIFTTNRKSPVFLSSSFAYLAPMSTALSLGVAAGSNGQNLKALMLGMIFVGIVYVVIALVIRKTGTGWLNKLLPPIVIGPVIMVIGLGLATSAVNNVVGGTVGASAGGSWSSTLVSTIIALVACFVTAFCATNKRKQLTLYPFVIGVAVAYVLSLVLTIFGNALDVQCLKIIDFSGFTTNEWNKLSGWVTTDFLFIDMWKQTAEFNLAIVGQVAVLFIPVSLVTVCEHIGDHKNLGNIIGKDLLNDEPGLTRTLIGDGVATAVSGCLCGAANTTYGENVAVVGVSKNASVYCVLAAAVLSIAFGLFRPIALALGTIPSCITGGVSLILYGFIASSGVKMLIQEKVDFSVTKNIVIASVILVVGIGKLAITFGSGTYAVQLTSTALSMILGIVLNLVIKDNKENKVEENSEESVAEEAPVQEEVSD